MSAYNTCSDIRPRGEWRLTLAVLLLCAAASYGGLAQAAIYKCVVDGRVTYQNDPCPSGLERKRPTVEELNAARKKTLPEAARPSVTAPHAAAAPWPLTKAPPRPLFACDGRTYCSQMTSCAEAKFFLASCPNTKMDGDSDGIPCEEQWCH